MAQVVNDSVTSANRHDNSGDAVTSATFVSVLHCCSGETIRQARLLANAENMVRGRGLQNACKCFPQAEDCRTWVMVPDLGDDIENDESPVSGSISGRQ